MRVESRGIALGLAIACGACFSPDVTEGQFSCGDGELCPPGFTCDPTGLCVSDGTDPIDAATGADARLDAAAIDASQPDAGVPQPARMYSLETGDAAWTVVDAAAFFDGTNAPDPIAVGAVFSHCTGPTELLCVSTPTRWDCTDDAGTSWFGRAWNQTALDLGGAAPTMLELWVFPQSPGSDHQAWITAGNLWWIYSYNQAPIRLLMGFWVLSLETDFTDLGTLDTLWGPDDNSPPSPSSAVADLLADGDALVWRVWDDAGVEYAYDLETGLWGAPEPAPLLGVPGAPPASLIDGATRCGNTTYVFTRAGVP